MERKTTFWESPCESSHWKRHDRQPHKKLHVFPGPLPSSSLFSSQKGWPTKLVLPFKRIYFSSTCWWASRQTEKADRTGLSTQWKAKGFFRERESLRLSPCVRELFSDRETRKRKKERLLFSSWPHLLRLICRREGGRERGAFRKGQARLLLLPIWSFSCLVDGGGLMSRKRKLGWLKVNKDSTCFIYVLTKAKY